MKLYYVASCILAASSLVVFPELSLAHGGGGGALVGMISCFAELSHLFQSDAVGRVAARAISGRV